jgi:antitoxin ParD1/3/4
MPQINVSVPPALKAWVDDQVAKGRYSSPSDVIRELLRRAQEEAEELAWLQAELDKGMNSPIIEQDAREVLQEIMDENRKKYADHRSAA